MKPTPLKIKELTAQLQQHFIAKKLPQIRLHTLAELLARLERVEESGDGWSARCPSHPDSRPSLSFGSALQTLLHRSRHLKP